MFCGSFYNAALVVTGHGKVVKVVECGVGTYGTCEPVQ